MKEEVRETGQLGGDFLHEVAEWWGQGAPRVVGVLISRSYRIGVT